jgi:hypothetical protein
MHTIWIHYKENSGTKILLKKAQKHKKSNYGRPLMLRFYKETPLG